jgi:flavin-dependent dehydrogenase
VTEPVSGEGIFFAMTSGILAAGTLDDALRKGDVSERLLANYEQACRRVFRRRTFINSLLRFAVYRPALLNRIVHWSAINNRLLNAIVDQVCIPTTSSWRS